MVLGVTHSSIRGTRKAEAGGTGSQGYPQLHNGLQASLGSKRPCLKQNKTDNSHQSMILLKYLGGPMSLLGFSTGGWMRIHPHYCLHRLPSSVNLPLPQCILSPRCHAHQVKCHNLSTIAFRGGKSAGLLPVVTAVCHEAVNCCHAWGTAIHCSKGMLQRGLNLPAGERSWHSGLEKQPDTL